MERSRYTSVINITVEIFSFWGLKITSDPSKMTKINEKSFKLIIAFLAGCVQMFLAIWLSVQRWDHMNTRVTAFTKFGEYSICTIVIGYLISSPNHVSHILSITERSLDVHFEVWNDEQARVRNDAVESAKVVQKVYLFAGVTLWLFTNFTPALMESVVLMTQPLDKISEYDLYSSFFYLPYLTQGTISVYCFLSFTQSFFYLSMISTTSIYYALLYTAMKMLEAEVKVLSLSIDSETSRLEERDTDYSTTSEILVTAKNQILLETKFIHHVQHHQKIISSIDDFNKIAGMMMLAFNGIITCQLSLELYCTLETDEPLIHFLRMPGSVICYGVMCFMGQGLINQGENLRRTFEWFQWIDKPNWFKKEFIFMMMCMDKPLQIKPAGLYVLNANNFMTVIQAAYSYLNMMRSFKANRG